VQQFLTNPWNLTFYIIGITAASFHLGNGLWNFACKWGIAVSTRSQRAFGFLGAVVGIGFTLAGIAIVVGMHYGMFPLGGYTQ
jgi:succinate dehydrogenase / fumarate reductase cytochrome b subunit